MNTHMPNFFGVLFFHKWRVRTRFGSTRCHFYLLKEQRILGEDTQRFTVTRRPAFHDRQSNNCLCLYFAIRGQERERASLRRSRASLYSPVRLLESVWVLGWRGRRCWYRVGVGVGDRSWTFVLNGSEPGVNFGPELPAIYSFIL